jgi:SAM-dependent methyltransferase
MKRALRPVALLPLVMVMAIAMVLGACALPENEGPDGITGGEAPTLIPDVPFVMSHEPVVAAMLDLAGVGPGDVLYDLGCGEGRIVIGAAQRGARGVGIDIDRQPLYFAREYARRAGVEERVRFVRGNFFNADVKEATVVALYLSPEVNLRLLPKLLAELAPGSRIVSNRFDMGSAWKPDREARAGDHSVFLWVVPADRQARPR